MLTKEQILEKIASNGVGYYNKDNENKKDKKNKLCPITSDLIDNSFAPKSLGLEAYASLEPLAPQVQDSRVILAPPESLSPGSGFQPEKIYDELKTAIIQLFDNGEDQRQRYKLKVRLNLKDGDNPEFIANLTKDFRNFKKFVPKECRETIINDAAFIRKEIRDKHGVWPYMGKFHFNNNEGSRQIEPWTFAAVWWDEVERGWSGMLMIHDWTHKFDLFGDYISAKQRAVGVKAQDTFTHPNHQPKRAMTWAERRNAQK